MFMLEKLKQLVCGIKVVKAEVVAIASSAGHPTYAATFQEIGGQQLFTSTYAMYLNGLKTPRPKLGTKVILQVNRQGEVIRSGPSE
jgi:hypothetical protein